MSEPHPQPASRPATALRQFWRDKRGAAMLEAAIVFPVLVLLLVSAVEFSEAFTARRKAAAAASTLADLVAQASHVNSAELEDINRAAAQVMLPYPSTPLGTRISSVARAKDDSVTVAWSFASGGMQAYANGTSYTLPQGLVAKEETVIAAETTYLFKPGIGTFLVSGVTFTSVAYFKPRNGPAVDLIPAQP